MPHRGNPSRSSSSTACSKKLRRYGRRTRASSSTAAFHIATARQNSSAKTRKRWSDRGCTFSLFLDILSPVLYGSTFHWQEQPMALHLFRRAPIGAARNVPDRKLEISEKKEHEA